MSTVTPRRMLIYKIQKRLSDLSTSHLMTVASSVDDGSVTRSINDLSEPELYDLIVDYIRSDKLRTLEDEGMAQLLLLDDMLSDLLATDAREVEASQATPLRAGDVTTNQQGCSTPPPSDYNHPDQPPATPTTDIPTHPLNMNSDMHTLPPSPPDQDVRPAAENRDAQSLSSPTRRSSSMPPRYLASTASTKSLTAGTGGPPLGRVSPSSSVGNQMSDISEEKWKSALIHILEELDPSEYCKMLECLTKIPISEKTGKCREKMAQKIIEHFGLEESISEVSAVIDEIPRRDASVQDLLRPLVEKLKNKRENEIMGKRKHDPVEADSRSEAGKKKKCDLVEEQRPAADQQKSCPPEQDRNTRSWKKSIRDLKSSSDLTDTEVIAGKVVQKSGLRTYQTKDKVKKFFFYVAVVDETDSIKLMVYGKDHYQNIQEDKCYMFRRLIRDKVAVKVTTLSTVSETKTVEVPEELEMEARRLIYPESPVCSIKEAKSSADGTKTVEGTVQGIDPVEQVEVQREHQKTRRQIFQLNDDTDSTRICVWGENTKQCKDLSVGDVIKVTNLKTNQYHDTTSLNSTGSTQILKVQSVGVQNERIEIIGIIKARKKETQLEAEFNDQVHTFVVASKLLAETFGLKLDGDFKQSLLDVMPLCAEAEIKGNRIKKLTAASKM